eukprot:6208040-Pleurochrysis_carterae.AAC.1
MEWKDSLSVDLDNSTARQSCARMLCKTACQVDSLRGLTSSLRNESYKSDGRWGKGQVVRVIDDASDKLSAKARILLPAGSIYCKWHNKWPVDPERDVPYSSTWTVLHPAKWNKDVENAWRWASCELERVEGCRPS